MRFPHVDPLTGIEWSRFEVYRHILFQQVFFVVLVAMVLYIALRSWQWSIAALFLLGCCLLERRWHMAQASWRYDPDLDPKWANQDPE